MNSRLSGAIKAVLDAIAAVTRDNPHRDVGVDDDLLDDLGLNPFEIEGLSLILEERFDGLAIPEELWSTPLYRTPAALAEWCIRKSEEASWAETHAQRKRA